MANRNQLAAEMTHYAPQPVLGPRGQQMRNYLADVVSGENLRQGLQNYRNAFLQMSQAGLTGQPLTPEAEAAMMDILPGGGLAGITAFHGSPHLFEKFSLGKIGTGEGAQAYGHGLYFAENPEVARAYQDRLGMVGWDTADDMAQEVGYWKHSLETDGVKPTKDNLVTAIKKYINDPPRSARPQDIERYERTLEYIQSGGKSANRVLSNTSSFYKVDIPDKYVNNFLDWDKPLSEQSEAVRKIADELGLTKEQKFRIIDEGDSFSIHNDSIGYTYPVQPKTKAEAERLVEKAKKQNQRTGIDIFDAIYNKVGSKEKISNYLNERGIKGIRYLDQGSRAAGEGSRNFVVFDDKIIQMLERNNEPVINALRPQAGFSPEMEAEIATEARNKLAAGHIPAMFKEQAGGPYKKAENVLTKTTSKPVKYPLAPQNKWWGDADYKARGGKMVEMTPDEYLKQVRPINQSDELTIENVDDLAAHVKEGGKLDPAVIYENGMEDGRHRALMAKKLGIKKIPVIDFRK